MDEGDVRRSNGSRQGDELVAYRALESATEFVVLDMVCKEQKQVAGDDPVPTSWRWCHAKLTTHELRFASTIGRDQALP